MRIPLPFLRPAAPRNQRRASPLSRWRRRFRLLLVERCEPRDFLTSVTLTPVADNTIFENATSNSNGAGVFLFSGETVKGFGARRALLKFDVAGSIPAGTHIDSVTLKVHVAKDLGITSDFEVHPLQASWGEGISNAGTLKPGNGTFAATNDATWSDRFFAAAPPKPWASPGGDFSSTASATTSLGGVGFYQFSDPKLTADVQAWVNSCPAPNLAG